MKKDLMSEIRVALIGYVSVGKSTALNALLGDSFSEVSMKRTTAAVNFFRIKNKQHKENTDSVVDLADDDDIDETSTLSSTGTIGNNQKRSNVDDAESQSKAKKQKRVCSSPTPISISSNGRVGPGAGQQMKIAAVTHEEIRVDNETLRAKDDGHVVEKYFDVTIDVPITDKSIRADTNITLIDIPGINEAESRIKYKKYVTSAWDTFDCAIVVLDASQGVNTEEQIALLNLVKSNNENKKSIPTILLGNKVDDPHDEGSQALVLETRAKCMQIFGEGCSDNSLKDLIRRVDKGICYPKWNPSAVFIPVSARDAYFYRKASHLTLEKFDDLDKDTADKIGKDERGRQWYKLSKEEKFEVIKEALGTEESYEERLKSTNFGALLKSITYFVGTEHAQTHLLSRQIDSGLKKLEICTERSLSDVVYDIYKTCKAIGRKSDGIKEEFWKVYDDYEEEVFEDITINEPSPRPLARLFKELEEFFKLSNMLEWEDEAETANARIKALVRRQLNLVIAKENSWTIQSFIEATQNAEGGWGEGAALAKTSSSGKKHTGGRKSRSSRKGDSPAEPTGTPKFEWKTMSPEDWKTLIFSLLLPADDLSFSEPFARQKLVLEDALVVYRSRYNPRGQTLCVPCGTFRGTSCYNCGESCEYMYHCIHNNDGKVDEFRNLQIPESLNDTSHWGHIVSRYVKFCNSHPKNKSG